MTTNQLNTIEMTRHIRDALYEQLKDMSPEEQLAFYRETAQRAHRQLHITVVHRSARDGIDVPTPATANRS